jgi:hypothetical protein
MNLVDFQRKALHRNRMSGVSSVSRRIVLSYEGTSVTERSVMNLPQPTPAVGGSEVRSEYEFAAVGGWALVEFWATCMGLIRLTHDKCKHAALHGQS